MGFLLTCVFLTPHPHGDPFATAAPLLSLQGLREAAGLTKGASLACFIRPGMTRPQVERILGRPAPLVDLWLDVYPAYGIQVFWKDCFSPHRQGAPDIVQKARYVWAAWPRLGG
jgi:hypothetical protein